MSPPVQAATLTTVSVGTPILSNTGRRALRRPGTSRYVPPCARPRTHVYPPKYPSSAYVTKIGTRIFISCNQTIPHETHTQTCTLRHRTDVRAPAAWTPRTLIAAPWDQSRRHRHLPARYGSRLTRMNAVPRAGALAPGARRVGGDGAPPGYSRLSSRPFRPSCRRCAAAARGWRRNIPPAAAPACRHRLRRLPR